MTTSQEPRPAEPENPEGLQLDNQLCFALYAASRAVTELYRPLLNELGVTYPQYLVLLVLWERDTRPVKDLTETLQLDYGTVSPLLKRLEAHGLVERRRASDNESRVLVSLTDAGYELRSRLTGVPHALQCALDRFDAEANRELLGTLRELTATAQAASPLTTATVAGHEAGESDE
ncbi:MAG: winged helix-turn-helix transcriptional regulator [Saccharopolyspora sp.]|uniref:MarR family winged helix-turn-helix transcriptional regulator n=1 Tax=Saccharopolyspora TaxID=1835 RepID=UPI00190B9B94|nr:MULTISPECIES: MarR family winged helix-turn-helix transcriptional regulator [unclassified Saccharopolyspora]MBK0870188.1 winged helix-turn-helix transcriptional regulator [Saccharopolyspora sp. HNM0986]MBQ6644674.1 winged helix-turn-helix transcriptional regulator [Saccharopolyspora sp.]